MLTDIVYYTCTNLQWNLSISKVSKIASQEIVNSDITSDEIKDYP